MNKEFIESYINGNISLTLNHIEQLTPIEAALFILELSDALVENCALGSFDVIELLKRRLKQLDEQCIRQEDYLKQLKELAIKARKKERI